MNEIRCLENYKNLKLMLERGEKGNADYFSNKLKISTRSFYRLIKSLKDIEQMNVKFNRFSDHYYLD